MSVEVATTAITFLFGVMVSILISGIPWAYMVHGRLSALEAKVDILLKSAPPDEETET